MKIVKSDTGGEYYGKYDESGQHPVHLLSSLRNVVFMLNTQSHVHHNKMVRQKGVIKP